MAKSGFFVVDSSKSDRLLMMVYEVVSKTADVVGMNCGHCAVSVSDALKRLDGVERAEVSLDQKNVIITLNEMKVTDEMITSAVDEAGYRVKSIS